MLAGVVVLSFWISGYGFYVLMALAPVMYGLNLGQRLKVAKTGEDFLGLLKGSAKVVFAYGILFSVGLVCPNLIH